MPFSFLFSVCSPFFFGEFPYPHRQVESLATDERRAVETPQQCGRPEPAIQIPMPTTPRVLVNAFLGLPDLQAGVVRAPGLKLHGMGAAQRPQDDRVWSCYDLREGQGGSAPSGSFPTMMVGRSVPGGPADLLAAAMGLCSRGHRGGDLEKHLIWLAVNGMCLSGLGGPQSATFAAQWAGPDRRQNCSLRIQLQSSGPPRFWFTACATG